jgi:hypothetical protein
VGYLRNRHLEVAETLNNKYPQERNPEEGEDPEASLPPVFFCAFEPASDRYRHNATVSLTPSRIAVM